MAATAILGYVGIVALGNKDVDLCARDDTERILGSLFFLFWPVTVPCFILYLIYLWASNLVRSWRTEELPSESVRGEAANYRQPPPVL